MTNATFTLKRHDTLPRFEITLLDQDVPIDLLFLDVARLMMKNLRGMKVNAPLTPLDQSIPENKGVLYYDWLPADTDTAGTYQAEVEVRWLTGGVQTYPGDGYFKIKIFKDLDDQALTGIGTINSTAALVG